MSPRLSLERPILISRWIFLIIAFDLFDRRRSSLTTSSSIDYALVVTVNESDN